MDVGLLHIGGTVFTGTPSKLQNNDVLFVLDEGNYLKPDEMHRFNLHPSDCVLHMINGNICIVGIFTELCVEYPLPGLTFKRID